MIAELRRWLTLMLGLALFGAAADGFDSYMDLREKEYDLEWVKGKMEFDYLQMYKYEFENQYPLKEGEDKT